MIRWFTNNGVAANLLMMIILFGGAASLLNIKLELFPPFSLGTINIRVPYRGAAPAEVEESICIRIEEKIQDLEGIKKITSDAIEGYGTVSVTVETGYDARRLLDEIKVRVDSIDTFPDQAEKPIIEELLIKREVMNLAIYGEADDRTLKRIAERVRDDLVAIPGISQVTVTGIRDYEVTINVPEINLRRYGLTFDQVVTAVRQSSLDMPGGTIKSDAGDILLRTKGQAYVQKDFEDIVVLHHPDGTLVTLADVASVDDGFVDSELETTFNGQRAVNLIIYEVGDQNPLDISKKVREYIEKAESELLPEGISLTPWRDTSFYLEARLNMLIENGLIGLTLVLIVLTLFLRPSLAIWVTLGIPISFFGTFFIMPWFGISINLISLFGFILVLGIVVDDAIVVGESVFSTYQKEGTGIASTIKGVERVAVPVTFAVLTTAVAFVPLLVLPGVDGKFLIAIPMVVIPTLLFSLVESKLILPYHLSLCHVGEGKRESLNAFQKLQRKISDGLERLIENVYKPILGWSLRERYLVVSLFIAVFILTIGSIQGGWVKLIPGIPPVPSDFIVVSLNFPDGTPAHQTRRALDRIDESLGAVLAEFEEEGFENVIQKSKITLGEQSFGGGPIGADRSENRSNLGEVVVELAKSEDREVSAIELSKRWREQVGQIPGVKQLIFRATAAGGYGDPIDVQLRSNNLIHLRAASEELKVKLSTYDGLFDIRDNLAYGQKEIKLKIKPAAETLGLTQAHLGRQVRQAFFGEEAQRIQRGRDDVRVMVRYPEEERTSIDNLQSMRIRTADGLEVPFSEVAEINVGQGYSGIKRVDRARVVNVVSDADKENMDLEGVKKELREKVMPELLSKYPGMYATLEGEARDQEETNLSLISSLVFVLFVMFTLMAIPFKSYVQPLIVMAVIPFGLVGAVIGHVILGHPLSRLSMFGIIALSGVVVNDSLVLVDYINQKRRSGMPLVEAVWNAGSDRFRPILLTSLTTFVGLAPILLEKSLQAQFLIPMSISLSFGVLFATFITLLLVPCSYLILEDFRKIVGGVWSWWWGSSLSTSPEPAAPPPEAEQHRGN